MKKLFVRVLAVVALTIAAAMQTTAQQSFSYQAVIRDSKGELVTNQKVGLKFSLLNGGKAYYTETQTTDVNEYGNISVEIGKGTQVGDGKFSDVPWNTLDVTLRVEVDPTGGKNYQLLGETKISPAPYAMYATQGGGGAIANGASKDNGNLFEVTDREGRPVFAVTNDGIVVYVDDTDPDSDKARRSGFIVTGRTASKNGDGDLFAVTAEGTKVYVDDPDSQNDKARRSGFIVTGRTATKNSDGDLFAVNDEGTKVYVEGTEEDKTRRSGFVVTGRTATKDADTDIFAVDAAATTVYVDDSDSRGDKTRRSGFIVTGRTATKDSKIIDINSSRTNLTTATLSIANAQASEEEASVSALHISEENVTMNSSMAMEGGVRPALDVEGNKEYNIYISDNDDDDFDDFEFDRVYVDGDFNFYANYLTDEDYSWIASFHDTLIVPLTSQYSLLKLNGEGEETAILQDAYVVVFYKDGYINVWPMRPFNNFNVSFALTDFDKPDNAIYGGSADEYVRINATINSKEAYAGCRLSLGGQQIYTAKVETSQGTFDAEMGGYYDKEYKAVFGETVTLAVTKVPDGQVFDSWRCNGRRYTDSVLHLPITQTENDIYPVFKDISPVLWVQGDFKPESENDILNGSEGAPYKTVAAALGRIIAENDNTLRGFRINVINTDNEFINIGDSLDNHAKHITIDFIGEEDDDRIISGITDLTNVPVIIKNAGVCIDETSPAGDNAVKLSGKRLTLDNCYVDGNENNPTKRGLYVEKGELVMIGGSVSFCTAGEGFGGGAYVAKDATLSLKNEAQLSYNTAQKGWGVYLCEGATLNVSNSGIAANVFNEDDVYEDVYAAGACNFNVSGESQIDKVGLGNGAYVTKNIEGIEWPMTIEFSYIENPGDKIAEYVGTLPDRMQDKEESEAFFNVMFKVTDLVLLAADYSSHLKFDGNFGYPFITKKIYTKGTIAVTGAEVDYTYYRNDNEDEYLHLKYDYKDVVKYQNYWFVGDGADKKLYRDTTYISEGDDPMPFTEVEDAFFTPEQSSGNPLAVTEFATIDGFVVEGDDMIVPDENHNNPVMIKQKNIVTNCINAALFSQNLGYLKSLLEFENQSYGDVFSLAASNTYFGDDVEDYYFTEEDDPFNYSQRDIEEHFNKLRKGFDVTIVALGDGTVTDNGGKTYSGIEHLSNVKYNTLLTLTVSGQNFLGWSDGVSADETTRVFYIRGDVEIFPIFKQTEFTVSTDGPYKSFELINKVMEKCSDEDEVTIHVRGTVKGSQTLSSSIHVQSITIDGADGENSNGVLDGNKMGTVLTINTKSHVTIKNLTITRGYVEGDYHDDDTGNGGGIYNNGGYIILEAGAVISGNTADYRGGGIYNYGGTIVMESGSLITKNITHDDWDNDADRGGGGILTKGGEVTINAGATISNNRGGYRGGGIMLFDKAQVTLNGGSIKDNTAGIFGGGVMFGNSPEGKLENNAKFTMKSGSIENNKADMDYDWWQGYGGGVYVVWGEFVMQGGSIKNNQAYHAGGGVYVAGPDGINTATLTMEGGDITGNKVLHPSSGQSSGGGGVSNYGEFYMSGGTISGNTFVDSGNGRGIYNNGKLTMSGSATVTGTDGSQKDDIYLNIDGGKVKVIAIGGPLTNDNVATITMEDYDYDGNVLELAKIDNDGTPINTTTLMAEYGKFALSNSNYTIGFDGYIKEKITYGDKGYVKYKINSAESYKTLFDTLNAHSEINTENIYISVEENLTLDGYTPYMASYIDSENKWKTVPFKGVFDGNGKTFTINSVSKHDDDVQDFALVCLKNEGIIQNAKIELGTGEMIENGKLIVNVNHWSGSEHHPSHYQGFCDVNEKGGVIRNCWSNISVNATIYHSVGGICSFNYGVIENCINTGNLECTWGPRTSETDLTISNWADNYGCVGGICGTNTGTIKNCVNYGTISMATTYNVTGFNAGLNGIPGAICGALYDGTSSCVNCYWKENCVVNGTKPDNSNNTNNNMVYNDSRVRNGSATSCGYFVINTVTIEDGENVVTTYVGRITPGSEENCGAPQDCQWSTTNEGLNNYVGTDNAILKKWIVDKEAHYPSVLDFGN